MLYSWRISSWKLTIGTKVDMVRQVVWAVIILSLERIQTRIKNLRLLNLLQILNLLLRLQMLFQLMSIYFYNQHEETFMQKLPMPGSKCQVKPAGKIAYRLLADKNEPTTIEEVWSNRNANEW